MKVHIGLCALPLITAICILLMMPDTAVARRRGTQGDEGRRGRARDPPVMSKPRRRSEKPNIVYILTDDQDTELGSLNFMPKLNKLLGSHGAHFTNSFVTTPMCCPSRSSILTGMYVHNHNVYTNNDNCSSVEWRETHEKRNFGTYLSNAGYRTGYFGKYLNEYTGDHIPPGWTEWVGLIKNSRFYNYSLNFNGKKIKHYDNYYNDYLTDLIANDSVTFLKQSKQYFPNRPVAMVLSMPAPHGPEDSAPQYQHLFQNITTHRTPSWNFAPNPDKQWLLQYIGKMEPIHVAFTDMLQRKRLQTLQSVDDAIEKVVNELRDLGELDNTYIVFSSDHGYHLGQFGLIKGKSMPYEFDTRVPFFIRGPNIPANIKVPNIVINLDIAPTLLDMAGIPIPDHMDGRSVLKLFEGASEPGSVVGGVLRRKKAWRDTFLIERGKISTKKLMWRDRLEEEVNAQQLKITKVQRLEQECEKAEYQPPCTPNQEWVCGQDNGRLRIYKCRGRDAITAHDTCECPTSEELPQELSSERQTRRKNRKALRSANSNAAEQLTSEQSSRFERDLDLAIGLDETSPSPAESSIEEGYLIHHGSPIDHAPEEELTPASLDQQAESPGDKKRGKKSRKRKKKKRNQNREGRSDEIEEIMVADEIPRPLRYVGNGKRYPELSQNRISTPTGQDRVDPYPEDPVFEDDFPLDTEGTPWTTGRDEGELYANMTTPIANNGHQPVACRVLANNTVYCEREQINRVDYRRAQRKSIDSLIEDFRAKLEELKTMKKMLRKRRPTYPPEENFVEEEELMHAETYNGGRPLHRPDPYSPTEGNGHDNPLFSDEMDWEDEDDGGSIEELFEKAATTAVPPCHCDVQADEADEADDSADPVGNSRRGQRDRIREERKQRRLEKQQEREVKRQERDKGGSNSEGEHMAETFVHDCNSPRMKCFEHDNNHWRTAPFWTLGPFCFCPNSNNNTFWCLRTINETHDTSYCEFITGFISYYDLARDPYQLRNAVHDLSYNILHQLHDQLDKLRGCKGRECNMRSRPAGGTVTEDMEAAGSGGGEDGSGEVHLGNEGDGGSGEVHEELGVDEGSGEVHQHTHDTEKDKFLLLTNIYRLDTPSCPY